MKSILPSALAVIGLAMMPVASHAQEDSVSYEDAMQCSALFSLLAGASAGDEDEAESQDMAARWLVVAMNRDGTEDGSQAESEIDSLVDELIDALEEAPSEEEGEAFLMEGFDFCEAKHVIIAEEIDGIEFE